MAYQFMANQKNNFNTTASDLFDVDAGTAAVQEQANNVSTEASNMWEGLNQQYEDKMAELNITGVKDLTESGGEIGLAVANFAVTKLTGQGIAAWGAQGAKYVGGKISGLFKGSGATPVTESAPAVSPTDPTVAPPAAETPAPTATLDAPVTEQSAADFTNPAFGGQPAAAAEVQPGVYETSFGASTTTNQVGGLGASNPGADSAGGASNANDFSNPAFGGDGPREVTFNNPAYEGADTITPLPEGAGPISSAPGADYAAGGDIGAPMRAAMASRQQGGAADQAVNGTANGSDTGTIGGVNNEADTSFAGTQTHGGGLNESSGATTEDLGRPDLESTPDLATPEVTQPDLGATPLPGAEPVPTPTGGADVVPDAIEPAADTVATTGADVAGASEAALDTEAVVAGAAADTGVLAPLALGIVAIGGLIEGIMSMSSASADKPAPPPPVPDVSAGSINTGGLAQSFQAGI